MTPPDSSNTPLAMSSAPPLLLAAAADRAVPGRAGLIGITGPVGAGKSTLARMLGACVLSTDDYLPDYDRIPPAERDLPRHMDTPLLLDNLAALREGRPARVPVWSFQSHRREGYREVHPPSADAGAATGGGPVIVCEGIHALFAPVAAALDVRVFVEAPAHVRWKRWEHLERTGVRGWGVEKARAFFHEVAEPTFAAHAQAYRAAAHYVVLGEG